MPEEALQLSLGTGLPLPGSCEDALLQGSQAQGRLAIPLPALLLQHGCRRGCLHDVPRCYVMPGVKTHLITAHGINIPMLDDTHSFQEQSWDITVL